MGDKEAHLTTLLEAKSSALQQSDKYVAYACSNFLNFTLWLTQSSFKHMNKCLIHHRVLSDYRTRMSENEEQLRRMRMLLKVRAYARTSIHSYHVTVVKDAERRTEESVAAHELVAQHMATMERINSQLKAELSDAQGRLEQADVVAVSWPLASLPSLMPLL